MEVVWHQATSAATLPQVHRLLPWLSLLIIFLSCITTEYLRGRGHGIQAIRVESALNMGQASEHYVYSGIKLL